MNLVPEFKLNQIDLAASPRVRDVDNPDVMRDYAESMRLGHQFPPITIYIVEGVHVVVDGRHRIGAAQLIGLKTLAAEVTYGTMAEAAWAGAAANRTNGQNMTMLDKTRCVRLLLVACPEKMQHEIAEQVGCSPALVSKIVSRISKDTTAVAGLRGRKLHIHELHERIRDLVAVGMSSVDIRRQLRTHPSQIAKVRRAMGIAATATATETSIAHRIARIREMATNGYTAKQIAPEVGVHADTVRADMREHGIVARRRPVPVDIRSAGGRPSLSEERTQQIVQLLRDGATVHAIAKAAHTSSQTIASVRERFQIPRAATLRTRSARERRLAQIRTMAGEGYTTRQIAVAVKLGRERVRDVAKTNGIDIAADRVVGLTHRHNPTRIVDRIVQDAENMTAGAELIVFKDLDRSQLATWIASLVRSREQLSAFIRRLMQEQPYEAIDAAAVSL